MSKWCKIIAGIVLLPVCLGATKALVRVISATGSADTFWAAVLAGVACWLAIWLLLPKPMWLYVVGHELTHALWTWIFGGKVKRFKATANGGHVVVTKTNFLIALAPYFFPLYVLAVVVAFSLGSFIWGWARYRVWFHLLLGAAYAFHATLTWQVLRTRQSDLTQQGYFFSAVIIWLGNVLVLLLGLSWLTARVDLWTAFGWCFEATGELLRRWGKWL